MEKNILATDPNTLDEELVDHPLAFHEWAQKKEEAVHTEAVAKAALELVYAELEAKVRATPFDFGLDNVTEAAIKAKITTLRKYQRYKMMYLNASKKSGEASAMVAALQEKSRTLSKLVDLHGQDYWSVPWTRSSKDRESRSLKRKKKIRNPE